MQSSLVADGVRCDGLRALKRVCVSEKVVLSCHEEGSG